MNITFLGAGVFGQALANVARANQHQITFYDPYKYPDQTIEETTKNAEVLIYTAPSTAAPDILPKLPADKPLICASKGFLTVQPFERFSDFTTLGGAAFAKDIETHTPTVHNRAGHIELTTSSPLAEQIFQTDWLDIDYHWEDEEERNATYAILLCGAFKNVFAIGAGLLCDQPIDIQDYNYIYTPAGSQDFTHLNHYLYYDYYPYLFQAKTDLRQILCTNVDDDCMISASCGTADIAISCTPDSRNFRCGQKLRNHQKIDPQTTIEGLNVLRNIANTPDLKLPTETDVLDKILAATRDLQ